MNRNEQLSMALHALLHMSLKPANVSSEELAQCMGANPAQLRRTLGGLREAGLVASTKGRGGGWRLARELGDVTLRDVHVALNAPALFAIGHHREHPACLVQQAVNAALEGSLRETEAFLMERFDSVTLERLARDFRERMRKHGSQRRKKTRKHG